MPPTIDDGGTFSKFHLGLYVRLCFLGGPLRSEFCLNPIWDSAEAFEDPTNLTESHFW